MRGQERLQSTDPVVSDLALSRIYSIGIGDLATLTAHSDDEFRKKFDDTARGQHVHLCGPTIGRLYAIRLHGLAIAHGGPRRSHADPVVAKIFDAIGGTPRHTSA